MGRRVLVDLLGFTGARGGTETYARHIVRRLPDVMPGATFLAVTGRAGYDAVRSFFPGEVARVPWVGTGRVSWALGEILAVDVLARRLAADVIWTPANFGPILRGVRRVSTIHDVIYHLDRGSIATTSVGWATEWLMRRTARTATAVISGSHAAALEVSSRLGVPLDEIRVVPHGTSEPSPPADPWEQLAPIGVTGDRPIIMSSGNRLPHKNFEGLLAAVACIDPSIRPLTVITGGGSNDTLAPSVERLRLQSDVVLPGWVTPEQLEALYAVASLYVCPSLAEGFGLPVIDAMRRGCLVLAHDIPVLKEVGGESALYADATDPSAFGEAIVNALSMAGNDSQKRIGEAWAQQFTWERSAARTAAVIEHALSDHD